MEGQMTARSKFKQRVRDRAAKTGESYTAALRHFRRASGDAMSDSVNSQSIRLAVAQTTERSDPRDPELLRQSGAEIRELIKRAQADGARLVHFPEGALCSPHKRLMSSDPEKVAAADWSRVAWDVYSAELTSIARLAAELGIWVVLPAIHRLSEPHRPHNSLYVINASGQVETRYDERFMSQTKINFMYAPGAEPITFTVDGITIGCALGIEAVYADSFADYERRGVDLVLFSTTGAGPATTNPTPFFQNASVYAGINGYWISLAQTLPATSAVLGHSGTAPVVCAQDDQPDIVCAEISRPQDSRPWLQRARSGVFDERQVTDDARSLQRSSF
jgi:predicted amidohydrolase